MRIPWLACLLICPAFGQVVINEIMLRPLAESADPNQSHQWVELYNKGSEAVDLAGWKISGRDGREGSSARDLPAVSLPPGGYLVVHVGEGEDRLEFGEQGADYYTKDPAGTKLWQPEMDEVALFSAAQPVDFLAWTTTSVRSAPGAAQESAVAAGLWRRDYSLNHEFIYADPGDIARRLEEGSSLGRSADSADTDGPWDFMSGGGHSALRITPGSRNYTPIVVTAQPQPFQAESQAAKNGRQRAEGQAEWTILLYLGCDDPAIQGKCVEYVQRIYRYYRSDEKVRFVVLLDTKDLLGAITAAGPVAVDALGTIPSNPGGLEPAPNELPLVGGGTDGSWAHDEFKTGQGATLRDFVRLGKAAAPARYYALVIAGHGQGWKGVVTDSSSPGQFGPYDALQMSELKQALSGQNLDVVMFNSCLMGSVEVAYQIRDAGAFMVAQQEIMFDGLPFKAMTEDLMAEPDMVPLKLATATALRHVRSYPTRDGTQPLHRGDMSVISLAKVKDLVEAIDAWANDMFLYDRYVNKVRDDPADNVQVLVQRARRRALQFRDNNFVDLYSLVDGIEKDPGIPSCVKRKIPAVKQALAAAVSSRNTTDRSDKPEYDPRGLHIYFPQWRAGEKPQLGPDGIPVPNISRIQRVAISSEDGPQAFDTDEPFDLTIVPRVVDADTRVTVYSRNRYKLPKKTLTLQNPQVVVDAQANWWPAEPAASFDFVRDTIWEGFLEKHYRPVAHAQVLWIETPREVVDRPEAVKRGWVTEGVVFGECDSPYDVAVIEPGWTVKMTSAGSSDADMPDGDIKPYVRIWDRESEKGCSKPKCIQPSATSDLDAAKETTDNVDEDRNPSNSTTDDDDERGVSTDWTCPSPGSNSVQLHVWDNNHLFAFHNTRPSGEFVHPQSEEHFVLILCRGSVTGVSQTGTTPYSAALDANIVDGNVLGQNNTTITGAPTRVRLENATNGRVQVPTPCPESGQTPRFYGIRGPCPPDTPPGVDSTLAGGRSSAAVETIPIPANDWAVFRTGSLGAFRILFENGNPGPAAIVLDLPGVGERRISFNVSQRLSALPDEVVISPPAQVTVNRDERLVVTCRQGGRPLADCIVSAIFPDANGRFTFGTSFRGGAGTQARTGANGIITLPFQPLANGPLRIQVLSGKFYREVTVQAAGGPPVTANRAATVEAPSRVDVGTPTQIVFQSYNNFVTAPNTAIRVEVVSGTIEVTGQPPGTKVFNLTTDARGLAALPFKALNAGVISFRVTLASGAPGAHVFNIFATNPRESPPATP